jgi:hypothetical protein
MDPRVQRLDPVIEAGPTHEISGISVRGVASEERMREQPRLTHLGLVKQNGSLLLR